MLFISDMKPDFVRKVEDLEIKEREVAVLEVEITSETADVVWVKVKTSHSFYKQNHKTDVIKKCMRKNHFLFYETNIVF